MAKRRAMLLPTDAANEGSRRLRLLLRKQSYAAIARRLRCTEAAIRNYARDGRMPDPRMRARMHEVLGWAEEVWERAPELDAYELEPQTERRAPASTKPRPNV